VHFDARAHLDLRHALRHANGVVVLAFQFDVTEKSVANYDFLPKQAEALRKAGATTPLDQEDLPSVADLMGDSAAVKGDYFYYHGSSTRPPCHNTVAWIVFAKKLSITRDQVRSEETEQKTILIILSKMHGVGSFANDNC
jgi:carbonic anhydrase